MKSLNNIERIHTPKDFIMTYTRLYKSIGKNFYYETVFETDIQVIKRDTVERDTTFFYQFFGGDVTDNRLKQLVTKKILPQNKNEQYIKNIKLAFEKINSTPETFYLTANEIQDLFRFIYNGIINPNKLNYRIIKKTDKTNKKKITINMRIETEKLIEKYQSLVEEDIFEISVLITNFYIDLLFSEPFDEYNDVISLLIFHALLIKNGFRVFLYSSLFEELFKYKDDFRKSIIQANYNWSEGYSETLPLNRLLLKVSLSNYNKLEEKVDDYKYVSNLNKNYNIENTINKLGDIFTKGEVKRIHPYISETTINRTLKRMREEEKIRPLGKGRSSKWIKLYDHNSSQKFLKELNEKIKGE